jgi:hypothetical protein
MNYSTTCFESLNGEFSDILLVQFFFFFFWMLYQAVLNLSWVLTVDLLLTVAVEALYASLCEQYCNAPLSTDL